MFHDPAAWIRLRAYLRRLARRVPPSSDISRGPVLVYQVVSRSRPTLSQFL